MMLDRLREGKREMRERERNRDELSKYTEGDRCLVHFVSQDL